MRNTYIHYLFISRNRSLYQHVAKKHHTSGWKVYQVAHGKRVKTLDEFCIFGELHRMGIIN